MSGGGLCGCLKPLRLPAMSRPESSHPAMRVQRSWLGSIESSRGCGPRSRSPSPRGHRRHHYHHRSPPSRRSSRRSHRSPSPRRFSRVRSVGASSFRLRSHASVLSLLAKGEGSLLPPPQPRFRPFLKTVRLPLPPFCARAQQSLTPPKLHNDICKSFSPPRRYRITRLSF